MSERQEATNEIPPEEVRRLRESDALRFKEEEPTEEDLFLDEELDDLERPFFPGLSPHEVPYEQGVYSEVPGLILALRSFGADSELVEDLQAHGLETELGSLADGFPGLEYKFPNAIFKVNERQVTIFFPDRKGEVSKGFRLDKRMVQSVKAYNGRVIWSPM